LVERLLTPETVRSARFADLGSFPVYGKVFAQPLFTSLDGQHTLYVVTARNLVYAFDADDPFDPRRPARRPRWVYDAGCDLVVPSSDVYPFATKEQPPDIDDGLGIIATPVIDLGTRTLYVTAMTKVPINGVRPPHDVSCESTTSDPGMMNHPQHNVQYAWKLHAVDISSGQQKGAVELSHPGLDPQKQLQRAALTLANGRVYIAWSSFGDRTVDGDWDGYVLAYRSLGSDAPSLAKLETFQVAPKKHEGGIWHSGGGPAVDSDGNLYVVTGNGHSDDRDDGVDFDSSDVKLGPDLKVVDYFTPSFRGTLNGLDHSDVRQDLDLSVSGPMLAPEWVSRQNNRVRRVLHGSKQGILYNLDGGKMGQFHPHSNPVQMVTVFQNNDPGDQMKALHIHTTPVFWEVAGERRVYVASDWKFGIRAFKFDDNGNLDPAPVRMTSLSDWAFTQMSLSSRGAEDGVLWTIACSGCVDDLHRGPPAWHNRLGKLVAYDAERLDQPIYVSEIEAYPRFNAPTIANGRVYVPTFSGRVLVFGLTLGPVFSPPEHCNFWTYGCGNLIEAMCNFHDRLPLDVLIRPDHFVPANRDADLVVEFWDPYSASTGQYRLCSRNDHSQCGSEASIAIESSSHESCSFGSGGDGVNTGGGPSPGVKPINCGRFGLPPCRGPRFE
jgi:outer membrane protein assembly factor BamB